MRRALLIAVLVVLAWQLTGCGACYKRGPSISFPRREEKYDPPRYFRYDESWIGVEYHGSLIKRISWDSQDNPEPWVFPASWDRINLTIHPRPDLSKDQVVDNAIIRYRHFEHRLQVNGWNCFDHSIQNLDNGGNLAGVVIVNYRRLVQLEGNEGRGWAFLGNQVVRSDTLYFNLIMSPPGNEYVCGSGREIRMYYRVHQADSWHPVDFSQPFVIEPPAGRGGDEFQHFLIIPPSGLPLEMIDEINYQIGADRIRPVSYHGHNYYIRVPREHHNYGSQAVMTIMTSSSVWLVNRKTATVCQENVPDDMIQLTLNWINRDDY